MHAEIISVGDELLTGLVVNTNASFIGEALTLSGHEVKWVTSVGDDSADLEKAFKQAYSRSRLIVVTGGLGPTHDDITKKAAADFFQSKLILRKDILDTIEDLFRRRGREMPRTNETQAWVPEKAEILPNEKGTAPGLLFREKDRLFFILPGVPSEAEYMMRNSVLPRLRTSSDARVFRSRMLKTTGIAESALSEKFGDFANRFPEIKLAYLPRVSGVALRLVIFGTDVSKCERLIEEGDAFIRSMIGEYVYGKDGDTLERVLADLLLSKKRTISTAESCTGGLVADKLTNIPGSSDYFERGVVAYSNASKIQILGVPEEIICQFGAVSAETAKAMAEGIRKTSGTDIGLSTTGIAGPSGGTEKKPVGLVHIGYSDARQTVSEGHVFFKDRLWNKERFAYAAMDLARKKIVDHPSF